MPDDTPQRTGEPQGAAPRRLTHPAHEPQVPGESSTERSRRVARNQRRRQWWMAYLDDICAACGHVRHHVGHEQDPAKSPEGPAYYADMLDQLHPFEPSTEAARHRLQERPE